MILVFFFEESTNMVSVIIYFFREGIIVGERIFSRVAF
jgi:hypothetical protein